MLKFNERDRILWHNKPGVVVESNAGIVSGVFLYEIKLDDEDFSVIALETELTKVEE